MIFRTFAPGSASVLISDASRPGRVVTPSCRGGGARDFRRAHCERFGVEFPLALRCSIRRERRGRLPGGWRSEKPRSRSLSRSSKPVTGRRARRPRRAPSRRAGSPSGAATPRSPPPACSLSRANALSPPGHSRQGTSPDVMSWITVARRNRKRLHPHPFSVPPRASARAHVDVSLVARSRGR